MNFNKQNGANLGQLESQANEEFENYNFGNGATVVDHDDWDTSDPRDLMKIAYVSFADDDPEDDSLKISFHVRFDEKGQIDDVYGLSTGNGCKVGCRGEQNTATTPEPTKTPPAVSAPSAPSRPRMRP